MDNLRGSAFMVCAMAFFALEDMMIKAASVSLPAGEILVFFGIGGSLFFSLLTLRRGEAIFPPEALSKSVLVRALFEMLGRVAFTLALVFTPLSSTSAILQATPLVVVLGAAIFFGEKVGWRRWSAILVGFVGVLFIIRPGLEGFESSALFAVLGMLGFAGRDLATRAAPASLSNVQLGVYGFLVLIIAGVGLMIFNGDVVVPDFKSSMQVLAATVFGVIAYYALTLAMRTGEVSAVTPYRYTRLVFALIVGFLVFGERPDAMTLIGSAIIVSGGIYTLLHNRKVIVA